MAGPARLSPPFQVLRDLDVWRNEDLQNRDDYIWLRQRIGARRRALVRLSSSPAWTDLLGLQYATDWDDWSLDARGKLDRLVPHLSQVVAVNRRFSILRQRYNAALAALDQISIGTCVISPGGSVVLANSEAHRIFDSGDGLRLSASQEVKFVSDEIDLRFRLALASVLRTSAGEDCDSEVVFTALRRSGKQPFLIELTPLRDSHHEIERGFRGALIYVIDPTNIMNISAARLALLFNLSSAETEICQMMLNGLTAGGIAERRSVAEGTVKAQIRAIYYKTSADSRVGLLRLAMSVDPPIRTLQSTSRP